MTDTGTVTVSTGARLHFGFANLSPAHERLYGSVGVALEDPRVTVRASRASSISCPDELDSHVRRAVARLDVPGAHVAAVETLPRHVGLGSGTATALAVFAAVARAYGRDPGVRAHAPHLGRGRRSGVGVAAFEGGGFVLDAGRPTAACDPGRSEPESWTVPPVIARRAIPDDWRFVLVVPAADPGRSGDAEAASMRATIADADPTVATRIADLVTRRVLPAIESGDVAAFGAAIAAIGRLNGTWYADEQGGVYRPPVETIVRTLADDAVVAGAGQSSWGPAAYGVTTAADADAALDAGDRALERAGLDGTVRIVGARNRGAARRDPDPSAIDRRGGLR